MNYVGLDLAAFCGFDTLDWLREETGATILGFYLGPAPSHAETDWMPHRAELLERGWSGLIPIFVGQQLSGPGRHEVTAGQGSIDGLHAAALMATAGFPEHSNCFLDLEDGAPFTEPRRSYVKYWAGSLSLGNYTPAIYCSHAIAGDVAAMFAAEDVTAPLIWAFKVESTIRRPIGALPLEAPDPSGSGFPNATLWQREQNVTITTPHGDVVVDVTTSSIPDPSLLKEPS